MLKYYFSFDFLGIFCWSLFLHKFYDTLYEERKFGLRFQYVPVNDQKVLPDFTPKKSRYRKILPMTKKSWKKSTGGNSQSVSDKESLFTYCWNRDHITEIISQFPAEK